MLEKVEFLHFNIFYFLGGFSLFLIFWFLWRRKSQKRLALQIPFLEDLKKAEKKIPFWKRKRNLIYFQWLFFLLAVISLSVSLARPQEISSEEKISKNGVDILIALDISVSMLAEDLKPNRLDAAKKYIDNFVTKLKDDRVGLEIFAGKPFTQSPMTFDYNVIRYYLTDISTENINQRMFGLNGTAIGDAILSAVNRFKNNPDRTKVLVLLTDGVANVGVDPIFAAEYARADGVKIYTIGIGKNKNSREGFDEKSLKDIAELTGGKYFWAGNNKSLNDALTQISQLEKKEYKAETAIKRKDLFWPWLLWGYLSATISLFFLLWRELSGLKIIKK